MTTFTATDNDTSHTRSVLAGKGEQPATLSKWVQTGQTTSGGDNDLEEILTALFAKDTAQDASITAVETKNSEQDTAIEAVSDEIDGVEQDIQNQIRAFASHQEVVVHELPDPTAALAPEYAYLSNLWTPTEGFDGHQGPVEYSPGEYWNTEGQTANRAMVKFSSATVDIDGTVRTMRGFMQRAPRLQHDGRSIENFGDVIHNPVGGACPALYFGHDPSSPIFNGRSPSWQAWVKTSLAKHQANPWNLPASRQSAQFLARIHHGNNQHVDVLLQMTVSRTVDGVEYTRCICPSNPQPATWINALDLTDDDAATVEIEFRSINPAATLWLGNQTKGWTWIDPEDNPTAVARIQKIQLASLWQGELLASLRRNGTGQLHNQDWTIETNATDVTRSNNSGSNTWSHFLHFDCDEYAQSLDGSHGIVVVVERVGDIITSAFIPWTQFAAAFRDDYEVFAGKWITGGTSNNHKTLWASVGVHNGAFRLRVSCEEADSDSTVKIYRNN